METYRRKSSTLLLVILGVVFLAFAAQPLAAQNADITGTVTDPSGAVIPGATVTVVSRTTNQTRAVSTNESGTYTVPFLRPGLYTVTAEIEGFKTSHVDVELLVGQVARINVALEVGNVTEQIEVQGGAPLLTTENAALGTVIENRQIVQLPLNGRDYLQLIALSPNVSIPVGGGAAGYLQGGVRQNAQYSVAGQRTEFNRYTLDGMENTDPNVNSYVIRPSVDLVQEFKVLTGVYSAEFGRATSQVSVTTKSGGNDFHGSLFEFLRNDKLDAREWNTLTDKKNPFRRNQFGGSVGGPILRNKLFFFTNLEFTRDVKTTESTASVATAAMRAGDFSTVGRQIFDPLTRVYTTDSSGNQLATSASPFVNQMIPSARINPVHKILVQEFYVAPTVAGDSIVRNFARNIGRTFNNDQINQRIDYSESDSSNWFGRYSWVDEIENSPSPFPSAGQQTATKTTQLVVSNTRAFSPTVVNEFRGGWNKFRNVFGGELAYLRDVQGELGIVGLNAPDPSAYGIPQIALGNGLSGFGGGNPWVAINHSFQFTDNISIIKGNHSLKFGVEWRRDRFNNIGNQKAYGEFRFNTAIASLDPANRSNTGHSWADFMLGESSESARVFGLANALLRGSAYYGYIQDDWKVTPKLSLSLGLRYENTRPWHDKYRGIMNLQFFDNGIDDQYTLESGTVTPILTRPGSGDFYEGLNFRFHDGIPIQAGDQFLGRSLVASDNNDFAPRIGISYSPSDKWTFRTGVGVFYVKDTANPVFDMARNQAGRGVIIANKEKPNSNLSDPWAFQTANFPCAGWAGDCQGPFQVLGNDTARRTPYVFQWLFNIQHQLNENTALEIGYQANAGHKLEKLTTYNQAVLKSGPNDARSVQQRRPWDAYDRIMYVSGAVNSNYNALSVKLNRRFTEGLTYLIGYTWSKAIDDGSAIRTNSGDNLWPVNSYDLSKERGLSQFHTGQRFTSSAVYQLPVGKGRAFLSESRVADMILGGWQVGGIVTLADGSPQNVGDLGDTFGSGNIYNWPFVTGVNPHPDEQTSERFWDVNAFNPNDSRLSWMPGDSGRNVLIRPGTINFDMSLSKDIAITESQEIQFRFEAFNALNRANWNAPSSDTRNPSAFGRITSARTMRELQFALKYVF